MQVYIGGVRGTRNTDRTACLAFGGETTAVLVAGAAGECVMLDAGSGAGAVARRIEARPTLPPVLVLLTHFHLDHVSGLPSLPLLYRRDARVTIGSTAHSGQTARQMLARLMVPPFWPVPVGDLAATVAFVDWNDAEPETPYRFGGIEVRRCAVHHPGGCTAYRLDEVATGHAVVFATDVEWGLSTPAEQTAFMRLCTTPAPTGLLLFDGQFARAGLPGFTGWGHSTWEDAVDVARAARVGRLLVIHHAPQNDDRALAQIEAAVNAALPGAGLARAGMEVNL